MTQCGDFAIFIPRFQSAHRMRAAFLQQAFHEIDRRWGNVPHYLKQELGIDTAEIAQLRALYLE